MWDTLVYLDALDQWALRETLFWDLRDLLVCLVPLESPDMADLDHPDLQDLQGLPPALDTAL